MADTASSGRAVPAGLTPWPKGVSGNPSGRAKGLVSRIKELTDDGEQVARFMWRVFRGDPVGYQKRVLGDGKVVRTAIVPKVEHRMEAATWLADRGWGRPTQTHQFVEKRTTVFRQADGSEILRSDGGPVAPTDVPAPTE